MTHPSWVALQGMAHSFIELDKAVVHVIRLVSFLSLWLSVIVVSVGLLKKQESSRKTSISALLTIPKPLTVWITRNTSYIIATKGEISDIAQDFINYILSEEGQKVVSDNGYIALDGAKPFESNGATGKVVVAGSSSVTPVMEKLKEAYLKVNPEAEVEINQSDSTTGMTNTMEGICDIGMASRELKEEELAELTPIVIANDGIAVIVNKESTVDELSSEDVKTIFTGEAVTWDEIVK